MSARSIIRPLLFVLLGCAVIHKSYAADQGSALLYQGRLNVSGTPANGPHDFIFALWDAASDGVSVSGPISKNALPVANGQFATTLDFGSAAFSGGARWIEVRVKPSGNSDPYTTLAPRQQFASLPYALYALSSPSPTEYPANRLTGTLPDARLSENISRITDLTTLSNNLVALMSEANTALRNQINSLSNSLRTNIATGVTVASSNPSDSALAGQGFVNVISVPAPSWVNGNSLNQPSARSEHTTIWTGSEMIVWGGNAAPGIPLASGGRYRPETDQWTPISTIVAPSPRSAHTAIWTGKEMIVWGGFGVSGFLATGGRYEPITQHWSSTSNAGAPSERVGHIAIWNGSRMIIWGGRNNTGLLNDGALYDPASDTWSTLALNNPPESRFGSVAVWTGSRLLIWGGNGATGPLNSGSQLLFDNAGNPLSWQPINSLNAPSPRNGHTAVWTGSQMIVWGGANNSNTLGDGAIYDPIADAWTALPQTDGPTARASHLAIWTGAEMIIYGGQNGSASLASGSAYDPIASTWRSLRNPGAPTARDHAGGVWTGTELLVFGGLSNSSPLSNLQRVSAQPAWYLYRKL